MIKLLYIETPLHSCFLLGAVWLKSAQLSGATPHSIKPSSYSHCPVALLDFDYILILNHQVRAEHSPGHSYLFRE